MHGSLRLHFQQRSGLWILIGLVALAGIGGWWLRYQGFQAASQDPQYLSPTEEREDPSLASNEIHFPRESWESAAIEVRPASKSPLSQTVELTGKVTLNDDRVAHVFPLVEGRVDEVKIQFGDKVKKGDLLVVVQSKEVGQAMLQLFQDRLQRDFAVVKDAWTQTVTANALAMLKLMRDGAPIEAIEKQLTNRPMGEYRDRLMTAYIGHYKSQKQMDRLAPLSNDGAVTGKQMLEAESELNAARATMQSLLEQLQQDVQQAATISSQAVKELQTRVAVDETNLKIIGFKDEDLQNLDPISRGETVSHYPVFAPFDGTVISKDVVLLERVGPDRQILSIADLTTVWVTTNFYEEHLPLLRQMDRKVIHLRSKAWPGKVFEARIFYAGDVVDEATRTISMRAIADNPEGLLKPGMFVNVELPGGVEGDVLQVPLTSILEYEGKSFVFVNVHDNLFERRDVTLGRRNMEVVEVSAGLRVGEQVVTSGGFVLKSRMLASLLEE